ncbi:MAG TPA: c-type cytochrome domain-containing protein, partial [Planctomycetaceae bacterium]|nr:c-type cytochrome domain-containing protein [Planctomycetaceae bacterium]
MSVLMMSVQAADPALQAADPAVRATGPAIDFNRDIRPILSNTCFKCHGPDEKERQAGLRLDSQAGATATLESGKAAVVFGKPEESELVRRVTTDNPDEHMPPASSGKKLEAREVELLRAWLKQGTPYAKHWSYESPKRPAVPDPKSQIQNPKSKIQNPIDNFILARLEREGLQPSPEADRYA